MVDDAHGIGVLGENGRGTAEHFDVAHEVDLIMGTFSKSLAAIGGFIAGDDVVIDYVRHHARSQIFSAAPPPASIGAAMKALEIVQREPERRKQLWENTDYMRSELKALGFDTGESQSPIIPTRRGRGSRGVHHGDSVAGGGGLREPGHHAGSSSRSGHDSHVLHGDPYSRASRPSARGALEGRNGTRHHLIPCTTVL